MRSPRPCLSPACFVLASCFALIPTSGQAGSVVTTTTTTTTTSTTGTTTLPLYREELAPAQFGSFNFNNLFVLRSFDSEHGWALFDLTGWTAADFASAKLAWTSTWTENYRDEHRMTVFAFEDPLQGTPDAAGHFIHVPDGGCLGPGNEQTPQFDVNCPAHTAFLFASETEASGTGVVMGCDYENTSSCVASHDVTTRLKAMLAGGAARIVFTFANANRFAHVLSDGAPELQLFVNDGVCGDPVGSMPKSARDASSITATDALFILRAAVGSERCDPCLCDADGSGTVSATDALTILRIAVGENRVLLCPDCEL
jgi:hypothetical protein